MLLSSRQWHKFYKVLSECFLKLFTILWIPSVLKGGCFALIIVYKDTKSYPSLLIKILKLTPQLLMAFNKFITISRSFKHITDCTAILHIIHHYKFLVRTFVMRNNSAAHWVHHFVVKCVSMVHGSSSFFVVC